MRFTGKVTVELKEGIFDPQGDAIKNSLNTLGLGPVSGVRVGKHIVVDVDAESEEEAKRLLAVMAEKLLANPVLEVFHIADLKSRCDK